jgi:hypothetical protein
MFMLADGSDLNARGKYLVKKGITQANRIPYSMGYYFFPSAASLSSSFPFLKFSFSPPRNRNVYFDYVETERIPLSLNSPFLFWLGLIGLLLWAWTKPWARRDILGLSLVLGAASQVFFMLMLYALSLRYEADLMPLFVVGSLFALSQLCRIEARLSRSLRFALSFMTASFATVGISAAVATMLIFKLACWSVSPDAKEPFARYIKTFTPSQMSDTHAPSRIEVARLSNHQYGIVRRRLR